MNGRLRKLRRLDAYLRDMALSDYPEVNFNYVTSQEDSAPRLSTRSGTQVLVARPELRLMFRDLDTEQNAIIETIFFALEPDLDAGKTDVLECQQYDRCCEIEERILERILTDCDRCDALAGLRVTDVAVRPEVKLFGSWNGYSMAISME